MLRVRSDRSGLKAGDIALPLALPFIAGGQGSARGRAEWDSPRAELALSDLVSRQADFKALSTASGSLSMTVSRIRDGASIFDLFCSQSRTRPMEKP